MIHHPARKKGTLKFGKIARTNDLRFMVGAIVLWFFGLCAVGSQKVEAETPPLLAEAIQRWTSGQGDLAFTQQTRTFLTDGQVKEERIERYDPSLPDRYRWRLIEVNGVPATDEQRKKWESRKNGKPRKKVDESPSEYLNLDQAVLIGENGKNARFRVPLKREAERILDVEEIDVVITVDKRSASIAGVGCALREPIRVLLGLVWITDLEVDLRINPAEAGSSHQPAELQTGSTARVKISRLGKPVEYNWSDFKRVKSFDEP